MPEDGSGGAPPGAAREAGCVAGMGAVLFPALAWGFAARLHLPLFDALFLSALVGLLPALAIAQVPLAIHAPVDRIGAYAGSAVMLGAVGVVAVLLGWDDPGPVGMGLTFPSPRAFATWMGILVGVAVLLQGGFLLLSRRFGLRESPLLRSLLPRTGREKRAFAGLSLVAGAGEEIAFRGYAIPLLAPVLGGPAAAVALTSVVFGLLHAYQGPIGIFRTALFGAVLAVAFVASGSLWPAMIVHFAMNVVVGVWLGERWV